MDDMQDISNYEASDAIDGSGVKLQNGATQKKNLESVSLCKLALSIQDASRNSENRVQYDYHSDPHLAIILCFLT